MADIKVYGAPWCPDCKRSKKFLAEHRIPYEWIDIDDDTEGLRFVEAEGRQKSVRIAHTAARPALICSRAGAGLPLDAASRPY
jgi:glutaredoxin-related protein